MDLAAIGAASIDMHMSQTMNSVNIAMMKKTMDLQENSAQALIQDLQQASPSFGHKLDVRA